MSRSLMIVLKFCHVLREICLLLVEAYQFKRIVGHSEISLSGKIDPGPAFPMDEFKKLITC